MTPIAQHITIKPHPLRRETAAGLSLNKMAVVNEATILEVSQDIVGLPVGKGDVILYNYRAQIEIAGSIMLHTDHIFAQK